MHPRRERKRNSGAQARIHGQWGESANSRAGGREREFAGSGEKARIRGQWGESANSRAVARKREFAGRGCVGGRRPCAGWMGGAGPRKDPGTRSNRKLAPIDFAEAGVDGVCRVAAVFGEERILHILPLLRIQHFWSLVPIDFAEAGIDGL